MTRRRWAVARRGGLALALVVALGIVVVHGLPRGPAVQTVALDGQPGAMVVDQVSGHAFIPTNRVDSVTHIQDPDTRLAMLDLCTGALPRTLDIGAMIASATVDVRTGRLLVEANDRVIVVDTHSGRVLATDTLNPPLGAIAVDERRGRAYVPETNGDTVVRLAVLDTRSGAVLRQVTATTLANAADSLTIGDAVVDEATVRVFVPFSIFHHGGMESTDSVATLDSAGNLVHIAVIGRWAAQPGQPVTTPTLAVDATHGRMLVIDANTGDIAVLDARSGRVAHTVRMGSPSIERPGTYGTPIFGAWALDAASGRLFIGTESHSVCTLNSCGDAGQPGGLYVLDTRTGRVVRRLLAGVALGSITVDAHERSVIAMSYPSPGAASFNILDAGTGALLRRIDATGAGLPVADRTNGRAYLVDDQGVATLDARSGRISQRVTPDASVGAGAAASPRRGPDDQSTAIVGGRVLVLRDGTTGVPPPDPWSWMPGWLRRRLPWQPPRAHVAPATATIFDAPK